LSLSNDFGPFAAGLRVSPPIPPNRKAKPAPFSIRLSDAERSRLAHEAAGAPLGTYIKAKLLGPAAPNARRSVGIADRVALAQVLAMLGRSRLASNLNQLAHAANSGSLPFTPEIEAELRASLRDVREIRRLLITSLGMKPEGAR
jgi:hypothetical protein